MKQTSSQYTYQAPPQVPQQPPMPPHNFVQTPKTKNKFLTFVFSLVPGAGQMYHGLYKKGVSIMLLFFGIIGLTAITYIGAFSVLLPVVWFYSFFDTINRMNMAVDEMKMLKDNYLFSDDKMPENKTLKHLFQERHLIIGWGLIIFAGLILLHSFGNSNFIYYIFGDETYHIVSSVIHQIPTIIIPILCIIIGIKLIFGNGQKQTNKKYDEYTIPESKNGEQK